MAEMVDRKSRRHGPQETRAGKPEADQRVVVDTVFRTADTARDTRHGDKKEMKRRAEEQRRDVERREPGKERRKQQRQRICPRYPSSIGSRGPMRSASLPIETARSIGHSA